MSFPPRGAPLLLDGAMGTALLARGLEPARESAASWNLSRPADVLAVHRAHVLAGAQVVLTNTFGAVAPSREECHAALSLARRSGALHVAASLWAGAAGLERAARDLSEADALWLETATSLAQARAALLAVLAVTALPVFVTLAVFPPPALDELRRLGAAGVGINCSPWPRGALAEAARGLDIVKVDAAGLAPSEWAAEVARSGAPMLGGCCGATAAHLAALRDTPR